MARTLRKYRHRDSGTAVSTAEATIVQAQFMIRIYAEIVAMDESIVERIRKLVVSQSFADDREATAGNLRDILAQIQKVGEPIAYWNQQMRQFVEEQLAEPSSS